MHNYHPMRKVLVSRTTAWRLHKKIKISLGRLYNETNEDNNSSSESDIQDENDQQCSATIPTPGTEVEKEARPNTESDDEYQDANDSDQEHSSTIPTPGMEKDASIQGSPPTPQDTDSADESGRRSNKSQNTDDEDEDDDVEDDDEEDDGEDDDEEDDASSADTGTDHMNENDYPLYEGAPISLAESLLAILSLAMVHNLTGSCITDILCLIALHCRQPNLCVTTHYRLKQFFSELKSPFIFHYFCNNCFNALKTKNDACIKCHCKEVGYFLEVPLISQLHVMFKRQHFFNDLQYRFDRKKKNVDNIEDIYDGHLYKKHFDNSGFLSHAQHISFMWYSDGIPLFKSSKLSIWPLFFVINELPYKKRFLRENLLVGGLWFGSKPQCNLFLTPFISSFQQLYNGIEVALPSMATALVRGMLLCGTCDLPAKCMFLNMIQFNGNYGCTHCYQSGTSHNITDNSRVHVYPYQENVEMRSHSETLQHARDATNNNNKPVMGVKGPTVLSLIMPDIINGTAIDIMHGVYLGVVRRLVHLWVESSFHQYPFSLSLFISLIDQRLLTIKPPNFVQRLPRSIADHLAYFKASEFKLFFHVYSLPVLFGIMKPEYFCHYMDLVIGISVLCKTSISPRLLNMAARHLRKFVSNFENLYGTRFMTINIHNLLHLPQIVSALGPLWVYSCFPFEDFNGTLLNLVHGTRYPQLQICSSLSVMLHFHRLINNLENLSPIHLYCLSLTKRSSKLMRYKINEAIGPNIQTIGIYKKMQHIPQQVVSGFVNSGIVMGNCQLFLRLMKENTIFLSKSYTRPDKTISYYVTFRNDGEQNIGLINCFIRSSMCNCNDICKCQARFFAIISLVYVIEECFGSLPCGYCSLKKVLVSDQTLAIDVTLLEALLFFVSVGDNQYVITPVNNLEAE